MPVGRRHKCRHTATNVPVQKKTDGITVVCNLQCTLQWYPAVKCATTGNRTQQKNFCCHYWQIGARNNDITLWNFACKAAYVLHKEQPINLLLTRSTGTVHTSVKARLTSVATRIQIRIRYGSVIRIPIRHPDRHQNLIICYCSPAHWQPFLKISCKSFWKFLRKVASIQTNRQTNKRRRSHILLGEGLVTNCGKRYRSLCSDA